MSRTTSEPRAFPFGVPSAPGEEDRDRRGSDTMNRLLLHGARHHNRKALFLDWERDRRGEPAWLETPDWRADRTAIRVALVLGQRLELARGEAVGLWSPLGRDFASIERGCWSIGAVSVPVWPEWDLARVAAVLADARPAVLFAPDQASVHALEVTGRLPESVRACIVMNGPADEEIAIPFGQLIEYGGVLDTPERASMWRRAARDARPEAVASREYGAEGAECTEVDQRTLVAAAAGLLERFPPSPGRVWALAEERPDPLSRVALYAAWADGLTRIAFAAGEEARRRLAVLRPEVVFCRETSASALVGVAGETDGEAPGGPGRSGDRPAGRLGRLLRGGGEVGRQAGRTGSGGGAPLSDSLYFVVTDRPEADPAGLGARRGGRVRFVPRAELGAVAGLPAS